MWEHSAFSCSLLGQVVCSEVPYTAAPLLFSALDWKEGQQQALTHCELSAHLVPKPSLTASYKLLNTSMQDHCPVSVRCSQALARVLSSGGSSLTDLVLSDNAGSLDDSAAAVLGASLSQAGAVGLGRLELAGAKVGRSTDLAIAKGARIGGSGSPCGFPRYSQCRFLQVLGTATAVWRMLCVLGRGMRASRTQDRHTACHAILSEAS